MIMASACFSTGEGRPNADDYGLDSVLDRLITSSTRMTARSEGAKLPESRLLKLWKARDRLRTRVSTYLPIALLEDIRSFFEGRC